jgi:hypothetical protein
VGVTHRCSLIASGLAARWEALDAFEGDAYRRALVEYEDAQGRVGIAHCYVQG